MLEGKAKTLSDISTSGPYRGCGRHNRGCNAGFGAFHCLGIGVFCAVGYARHLTACLVGVCGFLEAVGVSVGGPASQDSGAGPYVFLVTSVLDLKRNRPRNPQEAPKKLVTAEFQRNIHPPKQAAPFG